MYIQLPGILNSLSDLKSKNEMPCFKPEDVIFITNKWDGISKKNTNRLRFYKQLPDLNFTIVITS